MLNANLELLFITCKYSGPQEFKITFYVKAGKRYADRGWYLCNEAEWCLCLTLTQNILTGEAAKIQSELW